MGRNYHLSKDSAADKSFDDCVILKKDAFDPDAVFLDDIVDDEVLPYLSLKVDGLSGANDGNTGAFELRPDDQAAVEAPVPTDIPEPDLDPEQLEVYGWESSFWRKLKSYVGF
jgi:hypothetical protein